MKHKWLFFSKNILQTQKKFFIKKFKKWLSSHTDENVVDEEQTDHNGMYQIWKNLSGKKKKSMLVLLSTL